jgi:hypothetical protein
MKRTIFLALMAVTPVLNPLPSQNLPVSLPGNENKSAASPSTIEGSYPQNVDWFKWISNNWVADKKVTFTYAEFGEPLTELWDHEVENDQKLIYTYNDDNLLAQLIQQENIENIWTDRSRSTYEYDSYGQITSEKQELCDAGTWFVNSWTKTEYEMIGDKPAKETISKYNGSIGDFVYETRTTYTYGSDGLPAIVIIEDYAEGIWLNNQKMTYTWKSEGKEDFVIIDVWVETEWMKMFKIVYSWLESRSFDYVMYLFNISTNDYDAAWIKGSLHFDQHNNLVRQTTEVSNAGSWEITVGSKFDITYEGNHAVQRIYQNWNAVAKAWENKTKEVFKNFINLGIEDPVNLSIRLDCYPNPVADHLTLDYSAFGSSAWIIELLDMNGQTIKTTRPELPAGRFTWDVVKIPAGYYLVRMTDNLGRLEVKSIVKQ